MTGHIFVITGPSGVGKGTVCSLLLRETPELALSISATSRPMRLGETEGVSYYFKTREAFHELIQHDHQEPDCRKHHLLEWAEYNGNYYGTPRAHVEATLQQGKHVLLEIETQGAVLMKQKFPAACQIFIAPPDLAVLEQRLRGRGTEREVDIQNRLAIAQHEINQQTQFDHVVINANVQDCVRELRQIINAY